MEEKFKYFLSRLEISDLAVLFLKSLKDKRKEFTNDALEIIYPVGFLFGGIFVALIVFAEAMKGTNKDTNALIVVSFILLCLGLLMVYARYKRGKFIRTQNIKKLILDELEARLFQKIKEEALDLDNFVLFGLRFPELLKLNSIGENKSQVIKIGVLYCEAFKNILPPSNLFPSGWLEKNISNLEKIIIGWEKYRNDHDFINASIKRLSRILEIYYKEKMNRFREENF